jgi:hypothetical protein
MDAISITFDSPESKPEANMLFFAWTGWVVALLSWAGLLALHYPRPNLGGEQGMGYGLGLLACSVGFFLGLELLTGILARKAGWSTPWVLYALAGAGGLAVTVFVCGWLRAEASAGMPAILYGLSAAHGLIWIPVLTLGLVLPVLLMQGGHGETPLLLWRALGFMAGLGLLGVASWAGTWLAGLPARQEAELATYRQEDTARRQRHLQDIASWQPEQGMPLILSLTGRYHDPEVREVAVARIRAVPDWEEELIRLLGTQGHYYQVFHFLDGNDVDHPDRFIAPLEQSIHRMAGDIRTEIPGANNLQHWSFDYLGIERLTRIMDGQFAPYKPSLVPALHEVARAFQTTPPERFKGVRFDAARSLDQWLDRQKH